jgi:glycine oxidase
VSDQPLDVAVVGGGIIGLTSAFALAQRGWRVAVIDDAPGAGATRAAAGMLAPGAESTPEHAWLAGTTRRARELWPTLVRELAEVTGAAVRVHEVGSLFLAYDADDRREQDRYLAVAAGQGIDSVPVSRGSHGELFAPVSARIGSGALVTGDAFVDPDAVVAALVLALGDRLVPALVEACESGPAGVLARTSVGELRARVGIVATGVERPGLGLLSASSRRLRPVRGVTLRLRGAPGPEGPMVRAVVRGRGVYVIRRGDGSVIVGATSDESERKVVESQAVRRLLEDATTVLPELEEAEFVEARVGLRPAARDHVPFFETLGDTGWAWSSGHYRHGFLLAPLAAEEARAFVAGRLS